MAKFQDRKYPLARRPETPPAEEATYSDIFKLINTFKSFFIDLDAELENYLTGAPEDGQIYGQQDGEWVEIPGSGSGGVQSVVAGTGITVDDTDPANPIVSASGGGGGLNSPALVVPYLISADSANWGGYTLYIRLAAKLVLHYPTSWKFTLRARLSSSGNIFISKMNIVRTNENSLTVLSRTAITIGGVTNPTLSALSTYKDFDSDTINVQPDSTHDLWIEIVFPNTSNPTLADGNSAGTLGGYVGGDGSGNSTLSYTSHSPNVRGVYNIRGV